MSSIKQQNEKYEHLSNGRIFDLLNKDQDTLQQVICQRRISFSNLDAKKLIAFINTDIEDVNIRGETIHEILEDSAFYINKSDEEVRNIIFEVSIVDIIQMLKRYEIDVNDFGFEFDFIAEAYKEYDPALDLDVVSPTKDKDLLMRYAGYTPQFLVDPLVFMRGFNIIGAERGTGKTRLCLSLAYHIIFEKSLFLGCPIDGYGDVLYVNMEIPECDFKFFLEPLKIPFIRSGPELHTLYTLNTLDDPRLTVEDIENQISSIRPKLVIIDSFKMFMGFLKRNDMNVELNNKSVLEIYALINSWRTKYKSTILLTNHTNKGTSGQNGHSDLLYGPGALMDYADQIFLLRKAREPGQKLLILTKHRYNEEGSFGVNLIAFKGDKERNEITIELIEEDICESDYAFKGSNGKSYPPEMILKAQELSREGKSTREIGKEMGVHHATVARWLKKNL